MWTYYRNGMIPKKKKKRESTAIVRFPAIPSGPTTLTQATITKKRQSTSQRLQELFFSPLDKKVRTNKYQLQQRRVKAYAQSRLEDQRKTQGHLFKEKTFKALLDVSAHEGSKDDPPQLLQSLVGLGEEEEGEEEEGEGEGEEGEGEGEEEEEDHTGVTQNPASREASAPGSATRPLDGSPECRRVLRPEEEKLSEVTDDLQEEVFPPFCAKKKRFMVYICGGYKDTVAERTALMENTYPRLYLYCKRRGYEFRMVDLRWGVGDPAADRHDTAELHVDALRRCQETQGANFILFLGQKYEVRSLPSSISREAFESIVSVVERDRQRLSKNKPAEDDLASNSQSSIATGSDTGSFIFEPFDLSYADSARNSGLMSDSSVSQNSLSDTEGARASPAGARSWADYSRDLTLLQMWYKLDENHLPPVYRLLPVSAHHPDFLSRDGQRRRQARSTWRDTCLRLWGVLQRSGPEAVGEEGAALLLRTVLDWEMEQGLRSLGGGAPPEDHCHCYKRIIPDLHYNLKNEHAAHYIDLLAGRPRVNRTLTAAHQGFMDRIHGKLRHTNIYERNVGWGKKGLNPKHSRSHQFYAERISSHVHRTVLKSLDKVMEVNKTKGPFDARRREASRLRIQEEIQRHVSHGQALEKCHVLRESFLSELRRAVVERSSPRPLLLLGPPGWGKTTTLARLAQLAPSWMPGAVVLVCFVGLTGESRNVRLVLQNLCVQLAQAYSPHTDLSEGVPQLANEFHSLLGRAGARRPAVLVLDGLDELSEEHGPDLTWLSVPLPPHAYLALSAATDSACARTLQTLAQPSILSLPPLSPDDIAAGLDLKLGAGRRRLQDWQRQLLLRGCTACPSPLYLEAAYAETIPWSSFAPPGSAALTPDLRGLYAGMLARLERGHGEQLVRRAASVISVSRGGVTEEELLDLLARDDKVLQEVALSHPTSSRRPRVPCVLWARLRRDLGAHLTEAETDGTWVFRWTHVELARVSARRYLQTDDRRKAVHAAYADYFRAGAVGGGHAHVFQPLAWTLSEEEEEGEGEEEEGTGMKSYVFNLRKLHGLPYHLVRSGQILPFLSECMFNYDFLLHKTWALSALHVEEDLRSAVLPDKELADVEVLSRALQLSRPVLEQDPCQLASQILGRLGQMVDEDRPVAPGDPCQFSYLHALLAQCAQSSVPVLVPSYTCLLPPGGLTHTLLAGHSSSVTALGVGQGGSMAVTSGEDGSLKLWDLELGRVVRTLEGEGGVVGDSLTLGLGDKMLAVRMAQTLQVREVDSGRVVYTESDSMDVPVVTTACDGQLLVAFYDGSHLVKVFDLALSCSLLCCADISLESDPIHKDRSILVSHNSIKDYVLFAYRSGGQAAVLSARSGTVLQALSAQNGAASMQGVEMTSEYLLLFCRYPYKHDSEIVHIELFGVASFQYLRSILGCSQDYISHVTVNRAGTHAVAFCPSPRSGLTEVVTWNLETEDHKHIARFPGLLTAGVCSDLRFCLGVCSGERYLRQWDLASRIHDQTLTYNVHKKKSDGTEEVVVMGATPRYAVCRSLRPGTVHVWNLARRRFVGRPVRVEHGLYGNTDVALAHDLKLFILTDRGMATFTDTPSPIFQTLLVYDLIKRSYLRRQTGLYIVPCPQHEYRLLDGQLLMGLSETRDHLILWDLESGYIKGRIKPSHKESLLSSNSAIRDRQSQMLPPKETTALVMPWDRRTETHSAKRRRLEREAQREKEEQRRLDREKYNSIDQYLLSGDEQVVVCSYFAHHLNVFSLASQDHLHSLEDRTSLLTLHAAALTRSGTHLALANYSQAQRIPYLTLWDLRKGTVRKRLRNEPGVCCVAVTDDASRVAFGVTGSNKLKVWDPFRRNHKTISGYRELSIGVSSQLYMMEGGAKAILLSGELSLWDLETCNILSVLSPDTHVQCLTLLDSSLLLGLSHSPALITVRLTSQTVAVETKTARQEDLFGESSSSEDEDS